MSLDRVDQTMAWDFALTLYRHESLATHSIALQDRFGVNVNGLLLSAYLKVSGLNMPNDWLGNVKAAIVKSEQALLLHRQQRREAKSGDLDTYQRLKDEELTKEFTQHQLMINVINKSIGKQPDQTSEKRVQSCIVEDFLRSYDLPQSLIVETLGKLAEAIALAKRTHAI